MDILEREVQFVLYFDECGYLPPGVHELTFKQLRQSILVRGDETIQSWNEPWRRRLVNNLEIVVQPLWILGIEGIYIDGSFCTNKEKPGDIDGYYEVDLGVQTREEAFEQLAILAHELNSLSPYPVWEWWNKRPNKEGKLKCEMWHRYRIELFPNCYGVYALGDSQGTRVKFSDMYRKDKDGIEKGIVKIVRG